MVIDDESLGGLAFKELRQPHIERVAAFCIAPWVHRRSCKTHGSLRQESKMSGLKVHEGREDGTAEDVCSALEIAWTISEYQVSYCMSLGSGLARCLVWLMEWRGDWCV